MTTDEHDAKNDIACIQTPQKKKVQKSTHAMQAHQFSSATTKLSLQKKLIHQHEDIDCLTQAEYPKNTGSHKSSTDLVDNWHRI
jgi:hypothetical protein